MEDYKTACAFLIGNEGNGLTEETAACADRKILIPMEGGAESLNAAVASAVLIDVYKRQDLSGAMRKCRIGTAKFFTLLLLLYHL